ncbi:MAG: metallophosphoesterase [Bacteroidales bacterium]|nr:metallophosphoesterase [Bacteroidales bacterium]
MKKSCLLLVIWLLILTGCNSKTDRTAAIGEEGFSFAFLTDIHLQPERGAETGFQWAIKEVNKRKPDFVLTGGDMVMDALNQTYTRADSLYKLYQDLSGKFDMPVYNTIGNHEVYGWQREEENLEQNPEYGKQMYEKRLGPRYYSFGHKGWHFIILDGIHQAEQGGYKGKIEEEQMLWIANELKQIDQRTPIVISVHIPFITSASQLMRGSMAANSEGLVISNSREVLNLFLEHNLKLVLQGHLHFLEDIYVQNQVHFITGGAVSGKWWNNEPETKPEEGFIMVKVLGDDLTWEYVDFGWTPPDDN